jgi:hypothetical protein
MRWARLFCVFPTISFAGAAWGHHSPAGFDLQTTVDIRGEIVRYDWQNPHVYVLVDSGDGEWLLEADPTPLMSRSGWSRSTLQPGDAVSVRLQPDRDRTRKHGLLVSLTTPDGVTLGLRSGPTARRRVARSIAGVWDALPRFSRPYLVQDDEPLRTYTQAALRARAEYTDASYPPAACLAFPTPMVTVLPYLNEIVLLDDRVLIKGEFYGVERTIYMDGRDHPADGARTIQGHSIGRWDGETLVVDTRLYADYRLAHGPGVPSGAHKHTVERFELGADGTELNVEIIVEDPEFVVEPYTVETIWTYAPDRTPESFGCDSENASLFHAP